MKTNKRTSAILLTFICGIMLGLSGCMKDDMPNIITQPATTDQFNDGNVPVTYEVISIRHTGYSPTDKSYVVSMRSDGRVIFEGQYNTLVLGQRELKIDAATMTRVRQFFDQNNFFGFPETAITNNIATVSVSFRPKVSNKPTTNISNDTPGNMLFTFARQVEGLLGVSPLIYGGDKREPLVDLKE